MYLATLVFLVAGRDFSELMSVFGSLLQSPRITQQTSKVVSETRGCRVTGAAVSIETIHSRNGLCSKTHCGVCYACVVRRLALLVAGINERSYGSNWSRDSNIDNLVHLIRFSLDYLSDLESLPWYTVDSIIENHKEDLFLGFVLEP